MAGAALRAARAACLAGCLAACLVAAGAEAGGAAASCPLRFHCDPPGSPAPVPCRPASEHNRRALAELLDAHAPQEALELLQDSPALLAAFHAAAQAPPPGSAPCEAAAASELLQRLQRLGEPAAAVGAEPPRRQ